MWPQVRSCPPRGWSGAGVGVGMLRVSWFIGFFGCWFLGFLVSWFFGFLVAWFLGFEVSWFQSFNDPRLPTFHLMFPGRCWCRIQGFQEWRKRMSRMSGTRLFQTFSTFEIMIFKNMSRIRFWFCLGEVGAKSRIMVSGDRGHVRQFKTCWTSGKWKLENTSSPWIRIFLWSFWPFQSLKFRVKMELHTPMFVCHIFPYPL